MKSTVKMIIVNAGRSICETHSPPICTIN